MYMISYVCDMESESNTHASTMGLASRPAHETGQAELHDNVFWHETIF